MFYNLTPQDIEAFRQKTYPRELVPGAFLKRVVINDSASDNILKITYSVLDGMLGGFKIINNDEAKKYLKLKLFQIVNDEMYQEVSNFENIEQLQLIINSYGALSQDITPSTDYIGAKDKKRIKDLNYNVTFLIKEEIINYFTLGAIFYFDKEEFLKDKKIEERFIDEKLLFDKVYLYELIKDGRNIASVIQDIRLFKSTFKDFRVFDNLLALISSNKANNFLKRPLDSITNSAVNVSVPTQVVAANPTPLSVASSNTNNNLQASLSRARGKYSDKIANIDSVGFLANNAGWGANQAIEKISEIIKVQKETDKSSSKTYLGPYYSKNRNRTLGFVFIVNYEKIIAENTPYSSLLKRTQLKREFIDKCKISSIKILREKLNDNIKNKNFPIPETTEVIVASSQKDKSLIEELQTQNGSITEIQSPIDINVTISRAFSVTDKELFSSSARGRYRYGVELEISDGTSDFLLNHIDILSTNVLGLVEYLNETNKIVKVISNDSGEYILTGVYDPQRNAFTPSFIENFNQQRVIQNQDGSLIKPSYQQIIKNAASDFVTTLNFLGLNESNSQELIKTIISMLSPATTSGEAISYFIKIYETLIAQINRIIKDNRNNSFTIKKWFTNEYIDANDPIDYGYNFLDIKEYRGLGVVTAPDYLNRLEEDIRRHFGIYLPTNNNSNETINQDQINQKLNAVKSQTAAYLSVNQIYLPNKELNLRLLNDNTGAISNIQFSEFELAIKSYNNKGNIASSDAVIQKTTTTNSENNKVVNIVALSSTGLENNLSISIKGAINLDLSDPFIKAFKNELVKIQNVAQIELLSSILKQYESQNSLDTTNVIQPSSLDNLGDINTPIQIDFLKTNINRLLKVEDEYLNNIEYNSKFNLLFNTIHSVEILEFSDAFEENWTLLTRERLSRLITPIKNFYICRLRNYKRPQDSIVGLDNITLPIFNEHFLLFPIIQANLGLENFGDKIYKDVKQINNEKLEQAFAQVSLLAKLEAEETARAEAERQRLEERLKQTKQTIAKFINPSFGAFDGLTNNTYNPFEQSLGKQKQQTDNSIINLVLDLENYYNVTNLPKTKEDALVQLDRLIGEESAVYSDLKINSAQCISQGGNDGGRTDGPCARIPELQERLNMARKYIEAIKALIDGIDKIQNSSNPFNAGKILK